MSGQLRKLLLVDKGAEIWTLMFEDQRGKTFTAQLDEATGHRLALAIQSAALAVLLDHRLVQTRVDGEYLLTLNAAIRATTDTRKKVKA